ncbi:preprotein translocase subunit SecE [Chloroflexota bacterium]
MAKTRIKKSNLSFGFVGEIVSELKKVVWLSRQEAIYLATLVLVVSAAVGLFLGVLDYGFSALVNQLLLGG